MNDSELIFDLGVSEGNDTAYYLAKGFRVVAVEPDPETLRRLRVRFSREIEAGRVKLLPFAASDSFGDEVEFHTHTLHQGASGIRRNPGLCPFEYYPPTKVFTVDWPTLLALGMPRYVKIDIEGNEHPFLAGMARTGRIPEFISVECHELDPVHQLAAMGYRRFRLIDQNSRSGFVVPTPQLEGCHVEHANFEHASGPFGLDVFGAGSWLDLEAFETAWRHAQPMRGALGTWFDCHAWLPKPRRRHGWRGMLRRDGGEEERSLAMNRQAGAWKLSTRSVGKS